MRIKIVGEKGYFFCPGCKRVHGIMLLGKNGNWEWNHELDLPTFRPSILVEGVKEPFNEPFDATPMTCHSYITDGRIQFLSDCTHNLKSQIVDLPEIEKVMKNFASLPLHSDEE